MSGHLWVVVFVVVEMVVMWNDLFVVCVCGWIVRMSNDNDVCAVLLIMCRNIGGSEFMVRA